MSPRLASAAIALALVAAPMTALAASNDPAAMPAGDYAIEKTHAFVIGKVAHFGLSTYVFRFDKFDASYSYDPKTPDAAKLTVSIDLKSLNTGYDKANQEFPVEFMGADKNPTATFVSKSITHKGAEGVVVGDLTLNGVTKPVSLKVKFNGYGPVGNMGSKAGFAATTTVKRSEFGLGKYVPMVGDDIALEIDAEFVKK